MSKNCIFVGLLLIGLFAVWWCMYGKKGKEGYMAAGQLNHLDSIDPRYEMIEDPVDQVPAEHFADLVDSGDQARMVKQQPGRRGENIKPLERLERLQDRNLIPLTAAHVPQYNIDVANPAAYAFAVQAPRVILKDRQNMQADPMRGDIPIRYHPDVPLVSKSQYGRDSLRLDGFFSDHYAHLYNKLTGRGYKNMPLQVATEGTVMDYIPS